MSEVSEEGNEIQGISSVDADYSDSEGEDNEQDEQGDKVEGGGHAKVRRRSVRDVTGNEHSQGA